MAKLSRYQSVPLPFGLSVPGRNHARRVVDLLNNIEGKSLLDVGTYYGMFPAEAMARGASRAVGIEADAERYQIAKRIAALNGNSYEIMHGLLEEVAISEKFDLVLLLNVLHHVKNPIETVITAASHCRSKLIVEFCLPNDPGYISYCRYGPNAKPRKIERAAVFLQSTLLKGVAGSLPIMAVGNREYHRTFYFSEAAFHNIFVVHHRIFDHIEFRPSYMNRYRALAICDVSSPIAR